MVGDFQQSIYRDPADLAHYRQLHEVLVATGAAVCFRLLTCGPQHNTKVLAVKLICLLGLIMQALRGHVMYERYLLEVSAFFLLLFITFPKSREVWLWCGWGGLLQMAQLFRNNVLH